MNGVGGAASEAAGTGAGRQPDAPPLSNASPVGEGRLGKGEERDRKKLGIYYTPSGAARILCAWAIRGPGDLVLEPSFGACGFLEAARDQLRDVRAERPQDNLFGCDVDPEAFTGYLEPKLGLGAEDGRFFLRDFLSVKPDEFARGPFDVIVGNPPYVSYHNMDADQRATSEVAAVRAGFEGSPKSSLWAHFLLYAMTFLKRGGRMAWLLPSSFLYAEYATRVREHVTERFERCLVVQLGQRLFLSEGTEESTAVLLAEGYAPGGASGGERQGDMNERTGSILLDFAESLPELERSVEDWRKGRSGAKPFDGRAAMAYLSRETEAALERVSEAGHVVRLGDLADVRIGIVTGANPFFVIDEETANDHGLTDEVLRPILAKFSMAPGAALTQADLASAREKGRRLLLVDTDHSDLTVKGSALRDYLATFPRLKRHANKTFKKRELWHRPDDGRTPDAFFPYMYQHGPRLILNDAKATSTNTIHRVYFKDEAFAPLEGNQERSTPEVAAGSERLSARGWRRMCAVSILRRPNKTCH